LENLIKIFTNGKLAKYNMLAHSSLQMSHFLAGKGISAMDHLLYSPDLAPAGFWLFL
jgi:hypothetical protein